MLGQRHDRLPISFVVVSLPAAAGDSGKATIVVGELLDLSVDFDLRREQDADEIVGPATPLLVEQPRADSRATSPLGSRGLGQRLGVWQLTVERNSLSRRSARSSTRGSRRDRRSAHRQPRAEARLELEGLLARERVEIAARHLADARLEIGDAARREGAADEVAQRRVARRIDADRGEGLAAPGGSSDGPAAELKRCQST
ncbi:MAG: hypothetical protein IPK00_16090 [Deltaproteobacteria bacterium]|nr:hypothetical protein [Deltaproteobacteria bacterium]